MWGLSTSVLGTVQSCRPLREEDGISNPAGRSDSGSVILSIQVRYLIDGNCSAQTKEQQLLYMGWHVTAETIGPSSSCKEPEVQSKDGFCPYQQPLSMHSCKSRNKQGGESVCLALNRVISWSVIYNCMYCPFKKTTGHESISTKHSRDMQAGSAAG